MIDRRNFLKVSALTGSGVLLGNINPFTFKQNSIQKFWALHKYKNTQQPSRFYKSHIRERYQQYMDAVIYKWILALSG